MSGVFFLIMTMRSHTVVAKMYGCKACVTIIHNH